MREIPPVPPRTHTHAHARISPPMFHMEHPVGTILAYLDGLKRAMVLACTRMYAHVLACTRTGDHWHDSCIAWTRELPRIYQFSLELLKIAQRPLRRAGNYGCIGIVKRQQRRRTATTNRLRQPGPRGEGRTRGIDSPNLLRYSKANGS